MPTRQELQELASLPNQEALYTSLYLDVDPKNNPRSDWLLHYKSLSRETLNRLKPEDRRQVKADVDAIERFLADRPTGMKRGLALFSCRRIDFWKVYHTAVPFTNQMVIERTLYIKPLATMLDLYQRYLVAIVGGEDARLFLAGMGQLREVTAIARPAAVSDPTRDGGIGDMGHQRASRQREHSRRLLFKDVVAAMERQLQTEGIKRVLLGGTDAARGRFKESLSDQLRERVVGEFTVDRNAGDSEILERCLPVMRDVERGFEQKALKEVFEKAGAPMGSVLGLSDVLTALQQGNVRKLYVLSNYRAPGMVCSRCGALTPLRERQCPYCGGPMNQVQHMLDIAIQKAIDQGARIDMLEEAPELAKAGGIGAMLRY